MQHMQVPQAIWEIRPSELWSSRNSEIIRICMGKKRSLLQFKNTNGLSIKNHYLNSSFCLLVFSVCSGVSSGSGETKLERSVKLKRLNDSQVPQGSGLLCQLLQRSCMVGRVGANALVGSELSSNNWWFPSNFCEPYG